MWSKILLCLSISGILLAQELKDNEDPNKIVNGYEVKPGQYPFVVGLWYKRSSRPFCGASLITSTWVLTAAHCVYGKNTDRMEIMVGDYDAADKYEEGEQRRDICGKVVHHGYSPRGAIVDDVAVLELCRPVDFNHRVQPIGIAPSSLKEGKFSENPNATVAGWGTTTEGGRQSRYLRAVRVPLVSNEQCKRSYGFIKDGHICAGFYAGGKDSCQGDSGGPLFWNNPADHQPVQIGVVSSGHGCARPRYPGVYARVSHYHDWIHDAMTDKRND